MGGPAGPQSAHGRLDSAPKDSGGTAAGAPEGLSWTRQAWKVASFEKNGGGGAVAQGAGEVQGALLTPNRSPGGGPNGGGRRPQEAHLTLGLHSQPSHSGGRASGSPYLLMVHLPPQ